MATTYDEDQKNQQEADSVKPSAPKHDLSATDAEFSELIDRNFTADDVREMEDGAYNGAIEDKKADNEKADLEAKGFYNPNDSKKPRRLSAKLSTAKARRRMAIGGGITGVLALFSFFIGLSYPALQVADIKETLSDAHGAAQEVEINKRKMKVFGKFFFFREDGAFDGYRERGLFAMMTRANLRSDKLVRSLRNKGFDATPQLDAGGRWTGRMSIRGPDGTEYGAGDTSLWQRRSALRTAVTETFPTRNFMWRSLQAHKLYGRFGVKRTAWWHDNAATRRIEDAELRLRKKFRDKIFGQDTPADFRAQARRQLGDDATPEQVEAEAERLRLAQDAQGLLNNDARAIRADPDGSGPRPSDIPNGTNPASFTPTRLGKSVLNALKITAIPEYACSGFETLNSIESGSRTIKRLQLIDSFSTWMSLVDAVRSGTVEHKDVSAFMNLVTSANGETGKNFYQSGGWQWAKRGVGDTPTFGNTFNVGGGTTGQLAKIRSGLAAILGGQNNVERTCDTVTNTFFQIGSLVAGVAVGILSGGTITATQVAVGVSIELAVQQIMAYATPILTRMAAGALIDGYEKGDEFGDMLVAASGAAFAAQGANLGMVAVSKARANQVVAEYQDEQRFAMSQKPLTERLFDTGNPKSFVGSTLLNAPKNLGSMASIIVRPFGFVTSLTGKSAAQEPVAECNDPAVMQNNIATDPFCNPINTTDPEVDEIDPDENAAWMLDNGFVDDDNTPQGAYKDFIAQCFENPNVETVFKIRDFTTVYSNDCTADSEIPNAARFQAYRTDSALLECIIMELETGYCDAAGSTLSGPAAPGTQTPVTAEGLNGFAFPADGQPREVVRNNTNSNGPYAEWSSIPDSGVIGTTAGGKPIKVYIREAADQTDVKTIVIVSSIHGSENGGQFVSHELLFNESFAGLGANVRIIAIPEMNADSIPTATRKNANGVDLNRNNAYRWDSLAVTPSSDTNYKGPSPGSEPETQALNKFLTSIQSNVSLFIIYHDNLNWIAPVGNTPQNIATTYRNTANLSGFNLGNAGGVYVNQRGSLDGWFNTLSGKPTLLVEMSSDQSAGIVDRHVEAVKAVIPLL